MSQKNGHDEIVHDVTKDDYDVVVVGSGAGGGMAAYRLTALGAKVCLVEQGPMHDPAMDTPMFQRDNEAPLRAIGTPHKNWGYFDNGVCGTQIEGQPYTSDDGVDFTWYRAQVLGGRTNHYARHSPRMGPYDFMQGDLDGLSVNWPFGYDVMKPYYDLTEAVVGISGVNTGLAQHPGTPEDILQPAIAPRAYELLMMASARKLGIPAFQRHNAILTRNLGDRMACFYATPCMRGCSIGAAFQSSTSLIPMANKTGRLTIVTRAKVFKVDMGGDGKATGVSFVDTQTSDHGRIKARAVVLAASACASAQILLTSSPNGSKDGLANSSGQVGRNLTDTVATAVTGHFPALEGRPRYNEFGANMDHVYMPWWGYEDQKVGKMDFPRGYHIEVGGGFQNAPDMRASAMADMGGTGYGTSIRDTMKRYWGSLVTLNGRGEMVSNKNSYCALDTEVKNQWGFPVLRFSFEWTDYEYKQVAHMQRTFSDMIERAGGKVISDLKAPKEAISKPGAMVHEVGVTRMGTNPDTSVCDPNGRTWDVDNLYMMDGGVLPTNPHKNPTLHIMALAWKNCDHLGERLRKNEI